MTGLDLVRIETDGRVATVSFDTGTKANALSQKLMRELTQAARLFAGDPAISAVILAGRAENFTLGADLRDPEGADVRRLGLSERRVRLRLGPEMCEAWEAVDALTICAIEGWCVGGGAALAVSCDLRVASEAATIYVPEVERGMNMSWGSIPRFVALVGPARAKRIAGLCEKVSAETALAWGLVDYITPPGGALAKAREIAQAAAKLPPTALKMVKQDVNIAALTLAKANAHRDLEAFALMQQTEDFREGVTAFFEKRDPDFTGD